VTAPAAGPKPKPPKTAPASVLDAAVERSPALADAARLLRALTRAMDALPAALPPGVPHLPAAEARLAGGVPALEGEPLLDGPTLVRNVAALAAALGADALGADALGADARAGDARAGDTPAGGALAGEMLADWALAADALAVDALAADALAAAAVRGDRAHVAAEAVRLELPPEALVTLADFAARPVLRSARVAVGPLLAEARWRRGTCPACGAPPLLAELDAADRERRLRCARCASAWTFPRVRCADCGTTDHRKIRYLHGEGETDARRIEACDECGGYLKSIAVLEALSPAALLELDLATAALDAEAISLGFRHVGDREVAEDR
jgi:FdhE protein